MDIQKYQRISNCLAMMRAIEENGSASRKEIGDRTGLSLMTVGKMCAVLEEGGVIDEKKADKSECGRRASICTANDGLASCVINLADTTYTLTIYTPSGRTAASFIHTSPADATLEDRIFIFVDRMKDMLERVSFISPMHVCVITDLTYENGVLTDEQGNRADIKRAVDKLFRGRALYVYSPAACAAAFLEKDSADDTVAAIIGKKLSFSVPAGGIAPYSCRSVFPNAIRVDGISLGERLKMNGTPDSDCILAFFAGLSAFFPERKIAVFPLAESNGAMTCGEMCRYAVKNVGLGEKCAARTDPLGDMSEGARLMLLTEILKKHV
jgi:DNA-binding MarR family transcriptional regulator